MITHISGHTSVYGIIGSPVAHSRSPLMQNAGFAALGIDAVYVPFKVSSEKLEIALQGLNSLGVAGFNVTIPHKTAIMEYLDDISPEAQVAGAVNTVVINEGRLTGFNTDGSGLIVSLWRDLGFRPAGMRVLILGAGGAARGAAAGLSAAGVESIVLVNRTFERAFQIVKDLEKSFPSVSLTAKDEAKLPEIIGEADILINATSLGMQGEDFSWLPLALMRNDAKVYDMVYSESETALCRAASVHGLDSADGMGMLAAQGELAFELWTGRFPPDGLFRSSIEKNIKLSKS